MGIEEVMNLVVEKLKEALLTVENFGGEAWAWFSRWFRVALPYIIIAAVVVTVVVCFRFCLWPVFCGCCSCVRRCCCGFCGCVRRCCCCGRRVKMMKAPGRNCMMPRNVFESNPKGYFRNLRVHPGDQLC